MKVLMTNPFETKFSIWMAEANKRMSLFTAYETWVEEWHMPNMVYEEYARLYNLGCKLVHLWDENHCFPKKDRSALIKFIVEHIFYVLSMSKQQTVSMAALVSKLDTSCPQLSEKYEENVQIYADIVFALSEANIFHYHTSPLGHPVLIPTFAVKGELRHLLDSKFAQPLPQIGEVIRELDKQGNGLLPGIRFKGMSSKRKTPLNAQDRKIISMVSRQAFKVDIEILNKMIYYVPTISESGYPISVKKQEYTRIAYYRFVDMAEEADSENTVIQFPTTQDSRGRFYNAATDPAIRLSLRSTTTEGTLTNFESKLLGRK